MDIQPGQQPKYQYEIIPGILEKTWDDIEKKIHTVLPFASHIHIDIIDGQFAPNTTFLDPTPFAQYTSSCTFEVHLMVKDPLSYLDQFAKAGFTRFIGHIEQMPDISAFVAKAQLLGEVGLGIDLDTSLDAFSVPFDDIDFLLLMSVKAGFSGQTFDERVIRKIEKLREQSLIFPIEIDGGVNEQNLSLLKEKGATRFVSTGFLFGGEPQERYTTLHQLSHS